MLVLVLMAYQIFIILLTHSVYSLVHVVNFRDSAVTVVLGRW